MKLNKMLIAPGTISALSICWFFSPLPIQRAISAFLWIGVSLLLFGSFCASSSAIAKDRSFIAGAEKWQRKHGDSTKPLFAWGFSMLMACVCVASTGKWVLFFAFLLATIVSLSVFMSYSDYKGEGK